MVQTSSISQIVSKYLSEDVVNVKKSKIGFTNDVYIINDKYILKICKEKENETNFAKEVYFYKLFANKLPVPKIIVYDDSKKICKHNFLMYPKINGDNLYSKWHLMTNIQRKRIIKQLCEILRIINKTSYLRFAKKFDVNQNINWQSYSVDKINQHLSKVSKRKLLTIRIIERIKNFVNKNYNVLKPQKISLVYWDTHFDNLLVKNNKIVGILDFERTELASIDFGLDVIKRMQDYPKKYMSKDFEKFGKKKDYMYLLDWFKEFYPELFKFKDLDKRLALYSLEHNLDTLLWYPKSKTVKKMIAKTIGYKNSD